MCLATGRVLLGGRAPFRRREREGIAESRRHAVGASRHDVWTVSEGKGLCLWYRHDWMVAMVWRKRRAGVGVFEEALAEAKLSERKAREGLEDAESKARSLAAEIQRLQHLISSLESVVMPAAIQDVGARRARASGVQRSDEPLTSPPFRMGGEGVRVARPGLMQFLREALYEKGRLTLDDAERLVRADPRFAHTKASRNTMSARFSKLVTDKHAVRVADGVYEAVSGEGVAVDRTGRT